MKCRKRVKSSWLKLRSSSKKQGRCHIKDVNLTDFSSPVLIFSSSVFPIKVLWSHFKKKKKIPALWYIASIWRVELKPNKSCRFEVVPVLVVTAFWFGTGQNQRWFPSMCCYIRCCPELWQLCFILQGSKGKSNTAKEAKFSESLYMKGWQSKHVYVLLVPSGKTAEAATLMVDITWSIMGRSAQTRSHSINSSVHFLLSIFNSFKQCCYTSCFPIRKKTHKQFATKPWKTHRWLMAFLYWSQIEVQLRFVSTNERTQSTHSAESKTCFNVNEDRILSFMFLRLMLSV